MNIALKPLGKSLSEWISVGGTMHPEKRLIQRIAFSSGDKTWGQNCIILSKFMIWSLLSFNCFKATTEPTTKPTPKQTTKPPKPSTKPPHPYVCDYPVGSCSYYKDPCPPGTIPCPGRDKGCKHKTNRCCCYHKTPPPSKLSTLTSTYTWSGIFQS